MSPRHALLSPVLVADLGQSPPLLVLSAMADFKDRPGLLVLPTAEETWVLACAPWGFVETHCFGFCLVKKPDANL